MHKGEDGLLYLPHNYSYYAQVQGEMAIMNVKWCDFVVYSNGEVIVDRIMADYDYWTEVNDKLGNFYMQYVVPEILSGAIFMEEYAPICTSVLSYSSSYTLCIITFYSIAVYFILCNININKQQVDYQSLSNTYAHYLYH